MEEHWRGRIESRSGRKSRNGRVWHWSRGLRVALRAGVVFGLLLVAMWAWNSNPINLRDRIFPRHLAEVYPGWLYRSGQIHANLIESTLTDLEIDLIVDLTRDYGSSDAAQMTERAVAEREGIEWRLYPLRGSGTGEIDHYIGAVAAIARAERQGLNVLVHCRAGDRRTSGVIAAYQLLVRGEPPERAHAELGRYARSDYTRLMTFLDANMEEIARGLVERGVIEAIPSPLPRLSASASSELAREIDRMPAGS